MATIVPFFRAQENAFEPKDITAMSLALDDICQALNLRDDTAREVIATRIIDLARAGERNPRRLRERVLKEIGMADRMSLDDSAGRRSDN